MLRLDLNVPSPYPDFGVPDLSMCSGESEKPGASKPQCEAAFLPRSEAAPILEAASQRDVGSDRGSQPFFLVNWTTRTPVRDASALPKLPGRAADGKRRLGDSPSTNMHQESREDRLMKGSAFKKWVARAEQELTAIERKDIPSEIECARFWAGVVAKPTAAQVGNLAADIRNHRNLQISPTRLAEELAALRRVRSRKDLVRVEIPTPCPENMGALPDQILRFQRLTALEELWEEACVGQ